MSKPLFSEFEPVSAKAFKQKIQFDLKGDDYNDSVIWHSPEGIDIKPFYHRDDLKETINIPGQPAHWNIAEEIFVLDPKVSAKTANEAIEKGAEALFFKAEKTFKIAHLLTKIDDKSVPVYFNLDFFDLDFYKDVLQKVKELNQNVFLNVDIIGNLVRSGNWFESLDKDFNKISQLIDINKNNNTNSNKKNNNILSIDSGLYQNAGATIVQELAYALAHANEYLNNFGEKLTEQQLTFRVALSGNYFFEIAKIRALRLLYATLAAAYDLPETCYIIATPSRRNKVIYDYNTNMLRTTTECMSAILGGANTILNLPYDALYHKTNAFGQRISRNQLLILKQESHFETTANPADGTYYIESLTNQLAEKALELFKEIERGGGFLKQLKTGIIQRKIKESAQKEQERFNKKEKILLGTNKHPNPENRMKDDLEIYPFVKQNPRKTIIEPIIMKRLAEKMEMERLETESP
jgi:methylmalonyl-CoA mutase